MVETNALLRSSEGATANAPEQMDTTEVPPVNNSQEIEQKERWMAVWPLLREIGQLVSLMDIDPAAIRNMMNSFSKPLDEENQIDVSLTTISFSVFRSAEFSSLSNEEKVIALQERAGALGLLVTTGAADSGAGSSSRLPETNSYQAVEWQTSTEENNPSKAFSFFVHQSFLALCDLFYSAPLWPRVVQHYSSNTSNSTSNAWRKPNSKSIL